jgi:3'(2'), 5'-bisphosphate nucleotidase
MTPAEIASALETVLAIADRAASAVMNVYATDFAVKFKIEDDPVTAADHEANAIICDALEKYFPGVPVVAEESDPAAYAKWNDARAVWFVDPLDGTRDFVEKNGQFAVMIGLAEEGKAILGVVVCPALKRRFIGGPGLGSFEVAADGSRKKIHVTSTQNPNAAEMVVSRSRPNSDLDAAADALQLRKKTRIGSAGLKGITVACGEADIYAHLGRAGFRWDACAPEAIVLGAGGKVTDALGNDLDYRVKDLANEQGMLMTNGHLHAAVLAALDHPTKR